jgi:hypothetical protein
VAFGRVVLPGVDDHQVRLTVTAHPPPPVRGGGRKLRAVQPVYTQQCGVVVQCVFSVLRVWWYSVCVFF